MVTQTINFHELDIEIRVFAVAQLGWKSGFTLNLDFSKLKMQSKLSKIGLKIEVGNMI